jgi:serine phosphatase RsbU (regulator of sigma subunit)
MIEGPILAVVALAAFAAAFIWGRSARRLLRVARRVEAASGPESDSAELARTAFTKDLHTSVLYALAGIVVVVSGVTTGLPEKAAGLLLVLPVAISIAFASRFLRHARLTEQRAQLEQRAEEVLAQEALAPRRWAARLAPDDVPEFTGFELGTLYQAGTGLMAGDFYDVFRTGPTRVVAVIGDVTGHGIEPSITAFQAKYLLRVFLRQFRDPAQALEELNNQMSSMGRGEEFISMCVVVFDTEMGTLRYCSAGHPAVFMHTRGDVRPLTATGPLVSLDPGAGYASREMDLEAGDLVVLYTDGLAEARNGEQLFGEDRIAGLIRRDPGINPDVLCKTLVEAAEDFATSPISDDIAILAIRRT